MTAARRKPQPAHHCVHILWVPGGPISVSSCCYGQPIPRAGRHLEVVR